MDADTRITRSISFTLFDKVAHENYFLYYLLHFCDFQHFQCAFNIFRFKVSARFTNKHSNENIEHNLSTSQQHPLSFKFINGESLIEVKEE